MGSSARKESVDVLLVEKDRVDADRLTDAFANSYVDSNVHVVSGEVGAIEFIHQRGEHAEAPPPNLILLDLYFPDEGGVGLLTTLKGDPKLRRPPVLVMVEEDNEELAKRAYDLSANAFIPIPDDPDEYDTIVETIADFWFETARLPPKSV